MNKLSQKSLKYFKDLHLKKEKENVQEGHYFHLEIYGSYIICLKVDNVTNAAAYIYDDTPNHNFVFVFDKEIEDYIIVHECAHLTFHILDKKGVPIDCPNQESFCYLLDYIYKEIMKLMNENKKKWKLKKL